MTKPRVRPTCPVCGRAPHDFNRLPERDYAYLFVTYLGDGTISRARRGVYRLRISCDLLYPGIIEECAQAMRAVMPTNRVGIQLLLQRGCLAEVNSYSKAWPCLFPQHGPGHKHERRIALAPWQEAIVDREPQKFLRGLLHSDGCRVYNHVNGKDYPRYFFAQVSDDIWNNLGIEWRQEPVELDLDRAPPERRIVGQFRRRQVLTPRYDFRRWRRRSACSPAAATARA